jgi:hypothetical protein
METVRNGILVASAADLDLMLLFIMQNGGEFGIVSSFGV